MSLSREEVFETTQRAASVFLALRSIRTDSQLALWSDGDDESVFDAKESAAMGVANLAFAIEIAGRLRKSLTPEELFTIGDAIQRSSLERPAVIPIEKVCCLEMAVPAVMNVWMEFRSVLSLEAGFKLDWNSWRDPKALDELAERIKQSDKESALHILQFLVESVDAAGFTNQDFDLLQGIAKREGAVVAAAIDSDPPAGYPWGDTKFVEDKFLWDNIQKGGNQMEILWESEKKDPMTPKRMKQRVLRYAVFNRYANTRNFDGERKITTEEREREIETIRRLSIKKQASIKPI